jgi:hypothetical protein
MRNFLYLFSLHEHPSLHVQEEHLQLSPLQEEHLQLSPQVPGGEVSHDDDLEHG